MPTELKTELVNSKKKATFVSKIFEGFKMSTHMIGQHHGDKIPILWLKAYPG